MTAQGLVDNYASESTIPRFGTSSTPEEWETIARTLYRHGNFLQAMRCFERALLPRETTIAYAYFLHKEAEEMGPSAHGKERARRDAFMTAAETFLIAAEQTIQVDEKTEYHYRAAECFRNARCHPRAAKAYFQASELTLCAAQYYEADMFDDALEVLKKDHSSRFENVKDRIVDNLHFHYLREQQFR